ncbi:MAG: 16S rRNA (cytosine(1402)-N(4))-methyltransferase RsmH [Clostridia bacterium]|nr:16S rRNA (cytosine(1402)-N(4))-methyltransferase RsmH [Clostridia bacterium]MBQ7090422.1 16S rRNA (cytosine(1402)-N(4))-methyltransferase RsmH [Clostridia bacterium]
MKAFEHYSVMAEECIEALAIRPNGIYVDATLGGGGHSSLIAERLEQGLLIGIDQDADAIRAASERLAPFGERFRAVKSNFSNLRTVLDGEEIPAIDGIIFDLGVSSFQLDEESRGFSYRFDAPLDMRMDREQALDAYEVVNTYSKEQLTEILYRYGEEKKSPKIAAAICRSREQAPIETTGQLVELIEKCFSPKERYGNKHPAKRTFQALRIEVNGELRILEQALRDAVAALKPGGRIAVMTFHSLEDRIAKNVFADLACGCICNKNLPICVCGRKPIVKQITHKPITASDRELAENNRSKPAKLRVCEKL